jgi:tetratricopeptide (TPR) repeat protein
VPWNLPASRAYLELEAGDIVRAKQDMQNALSTLTNGDREGALMNALVLSRLGDRRAQDLMDELGKEMRFDFHYRNYYLPSIKSALALKEGRSDQAVSILEQSTSLDLAKTEFPGLYTVYLRGLAYLEGNRPQRAIAEFQRIIDHPGIVRNAITGSLAHLQLARAYAMMGDKEAARKSYKDFLTLWKDADPDIPIYKAAKAEYAKLQ